MNVLVLTSEGQGKRKNDFISGNEGEVARFASECDGEAVDGKCGCRRSMAGIETNKMSTTMKVVDLPLTVDEFYAKIRKNYEEAWGMTGPEYDADIIRDAAELLRIAKCFPVGSIVEKRGNKFQTR